MGSVNKTEAMFIRIQYEGDGGDTEKREEKGTEEAEIAEALHTLGRESRQHPHCCGASLLW